MMRHGIILGIVFAFLFCSTAYSKQSDAPQATGSLSGRILNTDMGPVADVTIKVRGLSTRTDANGNFRLDNIPAGKRTVLIDGSTAHDAGGHYPTIPISANITANAVNPMPFQSYLHKQKSRNFVNINPAQDTVLTDPEVPGFEMRIPKGVHITGWDGKVNVKVSVRTVPTNRLPIKPLPKEAHARTVYMFYFDKIGGGKPDQPIPVKARNDLGLLPGEKAVLWYYDESPNEGEAPNDWAIAGTCTVTPDGQYIVTDPGVGIPKFCCGASAIGGTGAPNPSSGKEPRKKARKGDPVDLATGYFIHEQTDLVIPGIIPVNIKRYYRNRESGLASQDINNPTLGLGAFGKGTSFEYDWWLGYYGDMVRLIKPGNVKYDFVKQSGTCPDCTYVNTEDPEFRGAIITYDSASDTRTLRMRDGAKYKFDYVGRMSGELVEIADRNGNKISFSRLPRPVGDLDYGGYIYEIKDTVGHVLATFSQTYTNGNFYRTDSITDQNGRMVKYTYEDDPFSPDQTKPYPRLIKVEYPDGSTLQYGYDSSGRMNTITNGRGVVEITNVYNADNRVESQTQADAGVYNFSYTEAGGYVTQTTMSTPNGAQSTWSFNSDTYITEMTTPDGTTTSQKATGTNELISVTDPLDRVTSYAYYSTSDVRNGLVHTVTDPIGNVTTYEYESTYGMPTKITDALLKDTTFTYTITDGKVTKTEMRDPLSHLTTVNYDAYGMPTSVVDSLNHTTALTYDPNKHAELTGITDALNDSIGMTYDAVGRVANTTDARNNTTSYTYDTMDRVTSVTDPSRNKTRYYYDLQGNLIMVFDPKGNYIKYDYDDRDRITKMTDQLGRYETYAYYRGAEITSLHGDNLKSITDRKGQTTTFNTYDPMGRLTKVTYNDNSFTQYAYDAVGRVTNINDTITGFIGYTYNDFGCSSCSGHGMDKISQELTPLGTIDYTYDTDGRRLSMTVAGEPAVNYAYDDAGRLTGISRDIGGTVRTYSLGYDNANRRTSLNLPLATSNQFVTTTYGYDIANRLLSMLIQGPSAQVENLTYAYDPNGNRTSFARTATQTLSPQMTGTTYDTANEMLAYNSKTLTYDANGNLTSNGTNTFTWDARNRLTAISGGVTASFSYDALGRRISKTVNGTTTQYLYDRWDIIQEIVGSAKTNYIRTLNLDEPLTRIKADGTVRHYVQDALGSVVALTDDSGAVRTTYTYGAFGNTMVSGEASDNPFQYTGRENDGTGLYYYRNRYYSLEMHRFISEDPIRLNGGINYYRYVNNNPVTLIDPYGLDRDKKNPNDSSPDQNAPKPLPPNPPPPAQEPGNCIECHSPDPFEDHCLKCRILSFACLYGDNSICDEAFKECNLCAMQ